MAQGNQRPRHGRNPSRILRMVGSGSTSEDDIKTNLARKGDNEETIRYIKRILCASSKQKGTLRDRQDFDAKPLEELLPPLTSSNEVDVQLYALIAVILSNFVQTWYNRITPDQDFVAEVVQIIAHCTRGLEQRLRQVELEDLLLDELPALMISHIDAVRVAQDACAGQDRRQDIRLIYHSIHPNEALAPLPNNPQCIEEQEENEVAWSQLLVSRVLPLLLPPEDLQNPCLHVLVSEIFSDMIVHRVLLRRVSEPWLLWEGVTKALHALRPELAQRAPPPSETSSPTTRLEQFGLLSSKEAAAGQDRRLAKPRRLDSIVAAFWTTLQLTSVAWLFLRSFVLALMHASSLPARSSHGHGAKTSDKPVAAAVEPLEQGPGPQPHVTREEEEALKRPVVRMRVWTCISRLTALNQRMPWLSGLFSLLQWLSLRGPGQVCRTDGPLDRLLAARLRATLLQPSILPMLLQVARHAIFPNHALAEARVPPSAAEVEEIQRTCAETIVSAVPEGIRNRFFATGNEALMKADVEQTLELFGDGYINKHLLVAVVELIVVRLFPEVSQEEDE